jgi:hypothetical protein
MQRRHWKYVPVLAVFGLLAGACTAPGAERRVTDRTAFTLEEGDLRVGLWKVEYAVTEDLDVGTVWIPWALGLFNLDFKYEVAVDEVTSITPKLGFFSFDLSQFGGGDEGEASANFAIVTFEVASSHRWDDFGVTFAPIYTYTGVDGAADSEGTLQGGAAVTNLQLTATGEWRLSGVIALALHLRYLVFQDTSLRLATTIQVDPYTTIEVHGAAQSDVLDVTGAYSVVPSLLFGWESFHLRLGLGYGNMSIPPVNIVLPKPIAIPELDLYWLF